MAKRPRAYCLANNREGNEFGLKLAIASLTKHCTGSRIFVFRPHPTDEFVNWLTGFSVELVRKWPALDGNHCKPHALLDLLEGGWSEVTWLDTNVIVSRNCNLFFETLADEVLLVAELPSSNTRGVSATRDTAQATKRPNPVELAMASPVLRVTSCHVDFLRQWLGVLDEQHHNVCRVSRNQTPSDCESYRHLHPHTIQIGVLKSDAEILHCRLHSGYSIHDRIRRLIFGKPLFVHAVDGAEHQDGQQTSPYVVEARRYEWEVRASR